MHHFEQLLSSNDAAVFNSTWIMVPAVQFTPPSQKAPKHYAGDLLNISLVKKNQRKKEKTNTPSAQ